MRLGMRTALCAVLLMPSSALATSFNDFMPGARAMGMGQAYTAIADDPYAMFYNPAGTANTPYIQTSGSLGRLSSPMGPAAFGTFAYLRPFEPINTATVGAAYHLARQVGGADRDELMVHYAQEYRLPRVPLTKPMRVGGNFKVMNRQGISGEGVALGFDGSAQLRSGYGLTGSAGVRDFTTTAKIRPTLSFAAAYTWQRWLTLATDMRMRSSVTELHAGVEASFQQNLIQVRAGKGFQLDGMRQWAFGLGVNLSPMIIDFAAMLPQDRAGKGGGYQLSFTYKFGAPSYAGTFVGRAAAEAEALRTEIEQLRDRRKKAEADAKTADTRREISEGEQRVLQQRNRELQDEYLRLQKKRDEADYEAASAALREEAAKLNPPKPPMVRPAPPPRPVPPSWPKRRTIVPGDTLRTLAREYYGDANLWEKIYDANRDKIDRGLPQEGAEFTIPDPAK